MQAHVPHLITRNGIYYLRLRLPRHLVLGREEVKFSLHTRELDIAMSRAMLVIEKRGAIHNDLAKKAIQAVSSEAAESSLLTRQEAARYLKCSVKTVDRLCADDKLTKISIGRRNIRIRLAELKKLIGV